MTNSMQTTCPSCHAVFRVQPVQLEAHAGKVRCGKCAYVFNAFETLVTPIETVSLMALPEEDDNDHLEVESRPGKLAVTTIELFEGRPLTISEPISISFPIPTDDQIEREAEAINREIAVSAHPELIDEVDHTPKSGLYITPELHEKLNNLQQQLTTQETHARWRGVVWGGGLVVLCLLLVGQTVYFFRNQLAAYYPESKPLLHALCNVVQCKVELLANVELIKLESSELQSAPERTGGVNLSASLRNLAPYPQAYPSLDLTLTDSANQALARRHFTPAEYLPAKIKPETGMPSQDELPVKIMLELVGLEAVGYKLLVFYP